ncbi:hypothetical protein DPMN_156764 [Dreissena polymorpha]|uniref:Uncharacterized protein n=1 Tax=Dreissena polymorpha TaxID=45954 RepID=A0A9D4FQF2_DREPO|nr:hypothetical protein DPMN_156764 [Dreissena polymorpha]
MKNTCMDRNVAEESRSLSLLLIWSMTTLNREFFLDESWSAVSWQGLRLTPSNVCPSPQASKTSAGGFQVVVVTPQAEVMSSQLLAMHLAGCSYPSEIQVTCRLKQPKHH